MIVASEDMADSEQPEDQAVSAESPSPTPRRHWHTWLSIVALAGILALGAYFRFNGLNWDQDQHLHPDERFLTIVASKLSPAPDLATYLSPSRSPLSPYNVGEQFYVYGNFPLTVTRYVAGWVDSACRQFNLACAYQYTAYDGIQLVGRALSAALDVAAIALTFALGRRLFDERVGWLAALLLAGAVMPIQQAHFFTTDNWAAAMTLVSLYAAVRASVDGQRLGWWLLFGLGLGLAVASRINMAPLALAAVVAAAVWLNRQTPTWAGLRTPDGREALARATLGVVTAGLTSLIVFRLAMPYAFADQAILVREGQLIRGDNGLLGKVQNIVGLNPRWVANMAEIQRLQKPDAAFPPALQWTDRAPVLFPLSNLVLYGLGLPAGLAALAGLAWGTVKLARQRPGWTALAIPVFWSAFYFLFIGTRWVKSIRYFLPIYPMLTLLAAWGLLTLWQWAGARRGPRAAVGVLIGGVVGATLLWAYAFTNIYRQPVTRVQAAAWMYQNIASGATLLYTTEGGESAELQLPLKEFTFSSGGGPLGLRFSTPAAGTIHGVRFNFLTAQDSQQAATWQIAVLQEPGGTLMETSSVVGVKEARRPITIELPALRVSADTFYTLRVTQTAGDPILAGTSIIANEHWDDALPVRLGGRDPFSQYYSGLRDDIMGFDGQIPITNPDSESKREGFARWLDGSDVIVLSSQRALWSIPRLPVTFPLTIAYYQALFEGRLGFRLAAQFHEDVHLGPLYISDTAGQVAWGSPPDVGWPPPGPWAAEEAFSVYDHPPVWIFVKAADYDAAAARQVLASVDLSQQLTLNPGQATAAPTGLLMDEATRAVQTAGGTFRDQFNLESPLNRQPWLAAGVWWLAVVGLGWLTFPLTFSLLPGLPSRGLALSRIFGLLLIAYGGWLTASLGWLPHTRATLLLMTAALVVISAAVAWRQRRGLAAFVRQQARLILVLELVGLLLFGLGLFIRLGNPDVWDVIWGGEKPMDLSYFNAVLKSTTFPPYDPWYAGGFINYYYYGFVYVGALTKLLGVMPSIAYNLIIPMLLSMTGLAAFGVAVDLTSRLGWRGAAIGRGGQILTRQTALAGLAALALCVLLGNQAELSVLREAANKTGAATTATGLAALDHGLQTLDGLIKMAQGEPARVYTGDWFWLASRAIAAPEGEAGPITEFPFFTFLYADLHAHMIALPLTLLALGWIVNVALYPLEEGRRIRPAGWLVGALLLGVLYPTNSWDWPTYLVLAGLGIGLYTWRRVGRLNLAFALQTLLAFGLVAVLSWGLFYPFWESFGRAYSSLKRWEGSTTSLGDYWRVYGLFLFLIVTHLARELRAWIAEWSVERLEALEGWVWPAAALGLGGAALGAALAWRGYPIAWLVLGLAGLAAVLGFRPNLPPARRIILALMACALALTLIVEIVVLDGDISRMNTVFKFYLQVWVLLSVAGGVALAWAWPSVQSWGVQRRRIWQGALALLVLCASLYPVLATRAKWQIRMNPDAPRTLDGMAFMTSVSYDDSGQKIALASDYAAIQWLYTHIDGSPVIAEAHSDNPYRSIGNRIAMYTGLPTIIGWDWHQRQQRAVLPDSRVPQRIQDVTTLYNTTDVSEALAIMARYDVQYIYVGLLEHVYYSLEGLSKFDQMARAGRLTQVYQNEGVKIYRVSWGDS